MITSHLRMARPVAKLRQGRTDWYRIEDKGNSAAEVFIYDEIGYFGVTAKDFVNDLGKVNAKNLTVRVNSPGGDVFDGLAIYNAIKQHPANTTVIIDALAASAASFIAQAGDRVIMTRNSQMMIHDAMGLCVGNAADMTQMVDLLDKNSNNIADIYAQRAGGTVEEWRSRMQAETWYSANEAVAAGLADEVLGDSQESTDSWDLSIFNYAGRDVAPEPVISDTNEQVQEFQFSFSPDLFREAIKRGIGS